MKIKDLCTYGAKSSLKAGDAVSNGQYMFFTSSSDETKRYSEYQYDGEGIVMGTGGKASLHYYNGKFSTSSDCVVLLPNVGVRTKYLYYYFLRNMDILEAGFKGAGLKHTSKEYIGNIEIKEIPDTIRQDKIIAVLDAAARVMEFRQQQLQKLDELVKARFVEMFGDPVVNEKGWDMPLIEDVAAPKKNALKAGPFGSALKKEYYVESGYKVYGQEQVISGDHTFGDYYIDEERYKSLENYAVHAGDVLISLVGTYGKLLIMPDVFEPGIINPRLMKITFDKGKVNPNYFQYFFQSDSLKSALADNTHGGTMDILNLGIVRKIAMPLPPLELQNQFAIFVEQVGKSKVAIQKALVEAQLLFDSLMQKYFG